MSFIEVTKVKQNVTTFKKIVWNPDLCNPANLWFLHFPVGNTSVLDPLTMNLENLDVILETPFLLLLLPSQEFV